MARRNTLAQVRNGDAGKDQREEISLLLPRNFSDKFVVREVLIGHDRHNSGLTNSALVESTVDLGAKYLLVALTDRMQLDAMRRARHVFAQSESSNFGIVGSYRELGDGPDGSRWLWRPWANRSMSSLGSSASREKLEWTQDLTERRLPVLRHALVSLAALHQHGGYHGRVTERNVVQFGDTWSLVDPMLRGTSRRQRDLEEARAYDLRSYAEMMASTLAATLSPSGTTIPRVMQRLLGPSMSECLSDLMTLFVGLDRADEGVAIGAVDSLVRAEGDRSQSSSYRPLEMPFSASESVTPAAWKSIDYMLSTLSSCDAIAGPLSSAVRGYLGYNSRSRSRISTVSPVDHRMLKSLGLDSQWTSLVNDRSSIHSAIHSARRSRPSKFTASSTEALLAVNARSASRGDRSHVKLKQRQELENEASELRLDLLSDELITARDLAGAFDLDGVLDIFLLCRVGCLVGVLDHGKLLLPTFQFDEHLRVNPLVPIVNRTMHLRFPSHFGLEWWRKPHKFPNGSELIPAQCVSSERRSAELLDAVTNRAVTRSED